MPQVSALLLVDAAADMDRMLEVVSPGRDATQGLSLCSSEVTEAARGRGRGALSRALGHGGSVCTRRRGAGATGAEPSVAQGAGRFRGPGGHRRGANKRSVGEYPSFGRYCSDCVFMPHAPPRPAYRATDNESSSSGSPPLFFSPYSYSTRMMCQAARKGRPPSSPRHSPRHSLGCLVSQGKPPLSRTVSLRLVGNAKVFLQCNFVKFSRQTFWISPNKIL